MSGRTRGKTAGKPPISAHPAFPAIVALWFAALLGIGTMVLPTVLLERASEASGLASVFVAAQAPLGMTARIAIGLAAGVIGFTAGLAIAGRVVAAHAGDERAEANAEAMKPHRGPISAREEFGPDGIDHETAEEQSSPVFAESDAEVSTFEQNPESDREVAEPCDESRLSTEVSEEPASSHQGPVGIADDDFEDWSEPVESPIDFAAVDEDVASGKPARVDHAVQPGTGPHPVESELSIVELVDRFARALQQHRDSVQVDERQTPVSRDPAWGASRHDGNPAKSEGEGYSSLLALRKPSAGPREADRHAPVSSRRSAESALRDALAKLERMSGAA